MAPRTLLRQLERQEQAGRRRVYHIGKGELSGGIKLICIQAAPLSARQEEVGGTQDIIRSIGRADARHNEITVGNHKARNSWRWKLHSEVYLSRSIGGDVAGITRWHGRD